MTGSRKCPRCLTFGVLRYIGSRVSLCWICRHGLDPRGPELLPD